MAGGLQWLISHKHAIDPRQDPVPLVAAGQGCLYRNHMIRSLETPGRAWHIAYSSLNLHGIQAAVSAGLGVSILSDLAVLPEHRVIGQADGFRPLLLKTELVLAMAENPSRATRRLADMLVEFCTNVKKRKLGKI